MKTFTLSESHILYIGENATDNWSLLSNSSQKDIFLHLSSFSSAYGIIKANDIEITKTEIYKAGEYVKLNSNKAKNLNRVSVDYTSVSNVKKGEKVGQVIYKTNKMVKSIII